MEVINLLSADQKAELRSARLNVQLRKYILLSALVAVGILAIYGVGFYFTLNEKAKAMQQFSQDEASASQYVTVKNEAKAYKSNLAIANKVLSSGASYSDFLTDVARSLPAGSILTDLTLSNLGESPAATLPGKGSIILHARTTSYGGALQVKDSLEASDVFENVSIADIRKMEPVDGSTAQDKKYPFTINVQAVISRHKAGT